MNPPKKKCHRLQFFNRKGIEDPKLRFTLKFAVACGYYVVAKKREEDTHPREKKKESLSTHAEREGRGRLVFHRKQHK